MFNSCSKQIQIRCCTDLTKYTGTKTAAEQLPTLSTPTTKCLTPIFITWKTTIFVKCFTVDAYEHMQKFMGGHNEGSCRCTSNVTATHCAVEPHIHHLLQIYIKATAELTKMLIILFSKLPHGTFLASKRYRLNPKSELKPETCDILLKLLCEPG